MAVEAAQGKDAPLLPSDRVALETLTPFTFQAIPFWCRGGDSNPHDL